MKKTFDLQVPGRADARVLDGIKHDVRKYVKRERRKELPEGFTAWTFGCKVGADEAAASACSLPEISSKIDDVAREGGKTVYVEVIARPAHRASSDELPPGEPQP